MSDPNDRLCLRAVDFTPITDDERSGSDTGDGRTLEGYAAVFDTDTEINSWEGKFAERIAPGAFKKTIRERKPVLQFDHGHDARTGSVPIGKIESLAEDDAGLYVSARLFDNPVVEPIRQAIEGGAISGMSFRFKVVRDTWSDGDGKEIKDRSELLDLLYDAGERGPLQRTIKEVKLFEAGPVVFPAYPETSVGVRSLSEGEREEYKQALLDAGDTAEDEARNSEPPAEEVPVVPEAETEDETRVDPVSAAPESTPTGHAETPPTPQKAAPETRKASVPMSDETMTVEERASRQGEIRSRLTEIDTDYSGAELPEEIAREWDDLNAEMNKHQRAINAANSRMERLRELAEGKEHREEGSDQGRRSPAFHRRAENIYDVNRLRQDARNVDELGALYRDNAMRAVEQGRFAAGGKEAAQERLAHLLDNVDDSTGTLAKRVLQTGSPLYERAFGKAVAALTTDRLNTEERAALAVGSGATGGYAVPFNLDPTLILTSTGRINPLRRFARVESITVKTWQGVTTAGISVSRSAEAAEVAANEPELAQPEVTPTRVTGFIPFSVEIDQDWNAMRAEMARLLQDAKDEEESSSFVNGSGTGNNPQGIMTGATTLVESGTTNVFAAGDVYALEEALPPRWREGAHFLGNKSVYNRIRQFDTQGGAQMWERIGAGQPAELLGYSAHEVSAMSSDTTDETKGYLLFGDLKQFLIVDRVGMNVELVPHLLGANRRPTGQRGLLAIWRNTSEVLVPGAFRVLISQTP
ncbi:phage major capsid protein [Streptomyces microflavus]|uniref:phage major capsid protein n=1 Tax=Streptomyces microflavus TaxID=1919 RepID=UPI0036B8629F